MNLVLTGADANGGRDVGGMVGFDLCKLLANDDLGGEPQELMEELR
jgi:hypothetical protein